MRLLLLAAVLMACGPSVEDQIEQVAAGGAQRDRAVQELLLRPERAIGPLLAALEDPRLAKGHADIAETLVSLMLRIDDERLVAALKRQLGAHPDAATRARIAARLGMLKRADFIPELIAATADADGAVSAEAFKALSMVETKLSAEDRARLDETARGLINHEHERVREEAHIRVDKQVDKMLADAKELVNQARIEEADSLHAALLDYVPGDLKAQVAQAQFYMENGRDEEGMARMRELGAVLGVPRLARAPEIDGRLDDAAWAAAAERELPYIGYRGYVAEAEMECRFRIGYTDEALYIGIYNYDAQPDSLVAEKVERDGPVWFDDSIEIFLDANWDRRSYVQYIVSSRPTVYDASHENGMQSGKREWTADAQFATHVGADFWSLECRLAYDERWVTAPEPGERWGGNFCRNFRDRTQSTQWVYTYGDFHQVSQFGVLVFE